MITKRRIRKVLLFIVRVLRNAKTDLSRRDAIKVASWLETIVDTYCNDIDINKPFYIIQDGESIKCRFVRLPSTVAWVKSNNGVYYINANKMDEIIAKREKQGDPKKDI